MTTRSSSSINVHDSRHVTPDAELIRPSQSIDEMIQEGRKRSIDDYTVSKGAREEYNKAIAPLTKAPKAWNSWISTWEIAFLRAKQQGLAAVSDPEEWFYAFTRALEPVIPEWVVPLSIILEKSILNKTLQYNEVSIALRRHIQIFELNKQKGKLHRGIFGPTYGTDKGENTDQETDSSRQGRSLQPPRNPKKRQGSSNKRKRAETSPQRPARPRPNTGNNKECEACHGRHDLEECFYVFESKRPDYFRGHKGLTILVNINLKNNPDLATRVETLKREDQQQNTKREDS
ncbi:hypothetical protein F5Y00DRAFT_268997 [Daldinia vernicosa]|uniref:uncharacterized protein n=1 Tax=Daldinia vernicosa TaxID=114800 RepID=UPI0020083117|nr:uncharacterized protein F5Y00DRAFT_268997 [Daldinia vernicosa]KAI0849578.1 hypothetical protein F5Y00DRAFT_268997 [Daldinia vernicosa]